MQPSNTQTEVKSEVQTETIDTTFLRVISGELPSHNIYEDEYTYAFLSIGPVTPGHTLVIPKKFSRNIYDTDTVTLGHCMNTISKLANHLRDTLGCAGMNVYQNNEVAGTQAIFHLHFHLIPRYGYDHFDTFPVDTKLVSELPEMQSKLQLS
jgi:histidine triad (HIT) family protein